VIILDIDRRTLTGLLLILFLFSSWSIGIVLDLSPGFEEPVQPIMSEPYLWPILVIATIALTIGLLIKKRTPAYILAVIFWPSVMIGAYLLLIFAERWSLFLIVLTIGISAMGIWKGYKEDSMSAYLVGVALIGVLLLAAIFLGGGGEWISEEIGVNGEAPTIPWDDPGVFVETTFGGIGTFMLIILVGFILVFLLFQQVMPVIRSSTEKGDDEDVLENELSSTVDSAVMELREGKDIHSTILRCYQRMCSILEKKGAKNFEFMTPREFEKQAIRTLNVPNSKLSEIREVFELAKYSGYRLGEEEKDKAVKALKELRKELR